jgi:hypothetical protein
VLKAVELVDSVLWLVVATICAIAWGAAGFPHFAEVAGFTALGFACVGAFIATTWKKE